MEKEIIIVEDLQNDKLQIYYIVRGEHERTHYTYANCAPGGLVERRVEYNPTQPNPIEPFIELPLNFGRAFMALLNDEIQNKGINQRKVDMQAGKVQLLESQLEFTQSQLIKFIQHVTK